MNPQIVVYGFQFNYSLFSISNGNIAWTAYFIQVERVSHRDTLESFVQKSENLEKQCLAQAIRSYCELRVLPYESNRTVVFWQLVSGVGICTLHYLLFAWKRNLLYLLIWSPLVFFHSITSWLHRYHSGNMVVLSCLKEGTHLIINLAFHMCR